MAFIAGDIGGTKSWLAWVGSDSSGEQQLRFEKVYASADFASVEALLQQFMRDARLNPPLDMLILAVPGPVLNQRAALTNLAWTLDAPTLQQALGIPGVRIINDFQAAAAGVATLTDADVIALNHGTSEPGGVRVITGAGTGLGLAFMLPDAHGRYQSFATEGGHVDFAPANAMQTRLLDYLRVRYGHVSWERVASGSAMHDLYCFCCIEHKQTLPAEAVDGAMLGVRAEAGDEAAESALDLFIELYGAWVGNLALLYQPWGGLYIAGGVSGHLQTRMQSPRFMDAALDKGRMRSVVERTPIALITCNRLGVQGAIASAIPDTFGFDRNTMNSNTEKTRSGP
jgi:glucokinase